MIQIWKYFTLYSFLINLISCNASGNTTLSPAQQNQDSVFYNNVQKWFDAWELVSKNVYHLNDFSPVEFIFFDSQHLYSTFAGTIPQGKIIEGPKLFKTSQTWIKAFHKDSIKLPDQTVVPIGLMSFASELPNGNGTSFFVMPLLPFWGQAGVTSTELGTANLVTGVFIHEFSHSQQMKNFGRQMTEFEKINDFGIEFSDDIVQHLFSKDSSYTKLYMKELRVFEKAFSESDKKIKSSLIQEGLSIMRERHRQFFTGKYENLKQIDAFFLTMEGLGQFSMYSWFIHPDGASLPSHKAVPGVRRNKKSWSQDEGFILFLLLDQLSPASNWSAGMFGNKTESVIDLLERSLKTPEK